MSRDERGSVRREHTDDRRSYRAVVEEYDDQPDECTIFPSSTAKSRNHELVSVWISAKGPSFVDLGDVR